MRWTVGCTVGRSGASETGGVRRSRRLGSMLSLAQGVARDDKRLVLQLCPQLYGDRNPIDIVMVIRAVLPLHRGSPDAATFATDHSRRHRLSGDKPAVRGRKLACRDRQMLSRFVGRSEAGSRPGALSSRETSAEDDPSPSSNFPRCHPDVVIFGVCGGVRSLHPPPFVPTQRALAPPFYRGRPTPTPPATTASARTLNLLPPPRQSPSPPRQRSPTQLPRLSRPSGTASSPPPSPP